PPLSPLFPYTTLFRSTFPLCDTVVTATQRLGRWCGGGPQSFGFLTIAVPLATALESAAIRNLRGKMLATAGPILRSFVSSGKIRSEEHTSELQSPDHL